MSQSLFLNSDNADMTVHSSSDFVEQLVPALYLTDGNYEVACVKLEAWKSYYNISADLGNNIFTYSVDSGSNWTHYTIPDGNYSVEELDLALKRDVYHPLGHYDTGATDTTVEGATYYIHIIPNFNTNRIKIRLDNATYRVDLTVANSLATWLGFTPAVISTTSTSTTNPAVSNGVTTFLVHCDLITSGYVAGGASDVLMTFTAEYARSQEKFTIEPYNLIYHQITKKTISSVRIRITDQAGNLIDLEGEPVALTLHIRRIQ